MQFPAASSMLTTPPIYFLVFFLALAVTGTTVESFLILRSPPVHVRWNRFCQRGTKAPELVLCCSTKSLFAESVISIEKITPLFDMVICRTMPTMSENWLKYLEFISSNDETYTVWFKLMTPFLVLCFDRYSRLNSLHRFQ